MKPIAHIQTPYHEKFGIPRQPLLVESAWGIMRFPKNDYFVEAFRGVEEFSHLWLIFEFSEIAEENFSGLVRPPRYEGKKKFGVYATRTPHRPNRIGLSVVKFVSLEINEEIVLKVAGVDLVNGTPILDIKPYVPYVDAITHASSPAFSSAPVSAQVQWNCSGLELDTIAKDIIEKSISLDPRPAHNREVGEDFGVSMCGWNIRFRSTQLGFEIYSLQKLT